MVNKNIVSARLNKLREYLKILEKVQEYDSDVFSSDPFIYSTAERNLHLAIECLFDIGNHIIAQKGFSKPDSYSDIFTILFKNKIIPENLYNNLEGMAAFRNILVHDYLKLDHTKVFEIIKTKTPQLADLGNIYASFL